MDDADDQHAIRLFVIENNMLCVLMTARARCKVVGFSTKARIFGKKLNRIFEFTQIPICLLLAPSIGCISGNQINIGLSFG